MEVGRRLGVAAGILLHAEAVQDGAHPDGGLEGGQELIDVRRQAGVDEQLGVLPLREHRLAGGLLRLLLEPLDDDLGEGALVAVDAQDADVGDGEVEPLGAGRGDDVGGVAGEEQVAVSHRLGDEAAQRRDRLLDRRARHDGIGQVAGGFGYPVAFTILAASYMAAATQEQQITEGVLIGGVGAGSALDREPLVRGASAEHPQRNSFQGNVKPLAEQVSGRIRLAVWVSHRSITPRLPHEARSFLAPLPIKHLPLAPSDLERLDWLGLRTIGDLAALADQAASVGRVASVSHCRLWSCPDR